MPKIVVVYDSKSGNTEKMANAVLQGANTVKGTQVELRKVGTPFQLSTLENADAIVLGSPSEYGNITPKMRDFIDSIVQLDAAGKLSLKKKIGGVFGSYAWDGGWATDRLSQTMRNLGIKVILPAVSAVDQMGAIGTRINETSLRECQELGKKIAKELSAT